MKIIFDIFEGDDLQNKFMHYCDVFEEGKQLAEYYQVEMTAEKIENDEPIDFNKLIIKLKTVLEQAKRNVVFLGICEIDDKKTNEYLPFIKEGTQTITSGRHWGMFHDMLKTIGYKVETNEHMAVINAKLII
jgi:hypothetical protein